MTLSTSTQHPNFLELLSIFPWAEDIPHPSLSGGYESCILLLVSMDAASILPLQISIAWHPKWASTVTQSPAQPFLSVVLRPSPVPSSSPFSPSPFLTPSSPSLSPPLPPSLSPPFPPSSTSCPLSPFLSSSSLSPFPTSLRSPSPFSPPPTSLKIWRSRSEFKTRVVTPYRKRTLELPFCDCLSQFWGPVDYPRAIILMVRRTIWQMDPSVGRSFGFRSLQFLGDLQRLRLETRSLDQQVRPLKGGG
ncbi:hypothetical protein J437_LFUL008391 [Ladona fulva]|uniref:Uncharacterized protein n=1 Tax=Ladona fulva TaxID=123851 RepID=A0A8K0NZZ1_LADFU|nr:hypothetical protein J437_LFUL008391 [Ladona fulva]